MEAINQKITNKCLDDLIMNAINTIRKSKKCPDASSIYEFTYKELKKSRHYHQNYIKKTVFFNEEQ